MKSKLSALCIVVIIEALTFKWSFGLNMASAMYGTKIIRTVVTNEKVMFAFRSCNSVTYWLGSINAVTLLSILLPPLLIVLITEVSITNNGLIVCCVMLGDTSLFIPISVSSKVQYNKCISLFSWLHDHLYAQNHTNLQIDLCRLCCQLTHQQHEKQQVMHSILFVIK